MDQSRALNALAPFLALAKSATSPRASADLVTQATSAQNTYVFAELLQQPNVQALKGNEQYGNFYDLLTVFAWGTWEGYKNTRDLPRLSDAQTLKLRLLSLLTIASEKTSSAATGATPSSNLSYASLCSRLDLESPIDLEHLITQAIYSNLISATLNPANQTVVISSVAPLRDLAPGSIASMIAELDAWSERCETVLGDLEAEMASVKKEAQRRHARESKAEKQAKAVTEANEKSSGVGMGGVLGLARGGHNTRGAVRKEAEGDDGDEDAMEVDGGLGVSGAPKKKSGGGGGGAFGGLMGKFGSRSGR